MLRALHWPLSYATQRMAPNNHTSKVPQSTGSPCAIAIPESSVEQKFVWPRMPYHSLLGLLSLSASQTRNKKNRKNQTRQCFWHPMCNVPGIGNEAPWTAVLSHMAFTHPLTHLLRTGWQSTLTNHDSIVKQNIFLKATLNCCLWKTMLMHWAVLSGCHYGELRQLGCLCGRDVNVLGNYHCSQWEVLTRF